MGAGAAQPRSSVAPARSTTSTEACSISLALEHLDDVVAVEQHVALDGPLGRTEKYHPGAGEQHLRLTAALPG